MDKEFLDKQIEEKKHQRDIEKAKECQMDEALVRSSKLAILLEKREEEASEYFFRKCKIKYRIGQFYKSYCIIIFNTGKKEKTEGNRYLSQSLSTT